MSSFEDIKILYKVEGEEAMSYPILPEDFEGLTGTFREQANIVAERELPEGATFQIFIKEEDRVN
jgi:hypothetical protein